MRAQSVNMSTSQYGMRNRSSLVKPQHYRLISEEKSGSFLNSKVGPLEKSSTAAVTTATIGTTVPLVGSTQRFGTVYESLPLKVQLQSKQSTANVNNIIFPSYMDLQKKKGLAQSSQQIVFASELQPQHSSQQHQSSWMAARTSAKMTPHQRQIQLHQQLQLQQQQQQQMQQQQQQQQYQSSREEFATGRDDWQNGIEGRNRTTGIQFESLWESKSPQHNNRVKVQLGVAGGSVGNVFEFHQSHNPAVSQQQQQQSQQMANIPRGLMVGSPKSINNFIMNGQQQQQQQETMQLLQHNYVLDDLQSQFVRSEVSEKQQSRMLVSRNAKHRASSGLNDMKSNVSQTSQMQLQQQQLNNNNNNYSNYSGAPMNNNYSSATGSSRDIPLVQSMVVSEDGREQYRQHASVSRGGAQQTQQLEFNFEGNSNNGPIGAMMMALASQSSSPTMVAVPAGMSQSDLFIGGSNMTSVTGMTASSVATTAGGTRQIGLKSLSKQVSQATVSASEQSGNGFGGMVKSGGNGGGVKRSFSAVKNGQVVLKKQLSVKDESMQLMILKVKQQCTKKQFNDPNEIKKIKDKMKESTKGSSLGGVSGGASSNATIRIRAMKEGANAMVNGSSAGVGAAGNHEEEDDDDSDIASQQDVSLDLDDDDEEESMQRLGNAAAAVKRSASMVIPTSTSTAATLTNVLQSTPKLHLLKSVYAGRPMTVFFPYHKSCQQPKPRDTTRAVPCSEFEIKKFDLKYKINGDNPYKCVVKAFEEAGFVATEDGDWNWQWSLPKKDKVRKMNPFQRFNHFPGCWNLGRKDFMWRCLNRAKRRNPKEMDFVPNTYLLCNQGDWDRFLTKKEEASKNQLWICKPADQACGRGIKVISKSSKVKRKTNRIICDYIMNPHLIDGLKYDLRLYVLVTSYDPLRIYLYEEGLTRFATEKYTTNTKEVTKRYVHLTNYSVNKNAKKFVKNTNPENDGEGSKWSHSALRAKYAAMGIDVAELFAKISDVIIKTCISAEPLMLDIHAKASEHRTNCFELYGFDVLIDANLKPWILEVNVCPSLSSSSPLDRKIKHSLLVDTLNLVGITPYDKKHYSEQVKKNGMFHRASSMTQAFGGGDDETSSTAMMAASGLSGVKKNFSKNVNDIQELNAENCLDKLSPENWEILFETDEEYHRRGHYERIYPPVQPERREYYSQFFEFQRFNNIMVDKWMSSPVNFLQKIIKKKYKTSV